MLYALDSNIILYSEGVNDKARQITALRLIESIGTENIVVSFQALGESMNRLTKGSTLSKAEAAALLDPWVHSTRIQATTRKVFTGATELFARYGLQIWDAIILSSASVSGAQILFSEDMQSGFTWRDVTVLNPFADTPDLIVQELLKPGMH